ncbi:MAG: phospho-sugar mutase [Sarcina sp.]
MKLEAYEKWMESEFISEDLKAELRELSEDELYSRFYKSLEFGTAGLRGVMGAGTNRMNKVTVALATQGFADYLNNKFDNPTVAIAHDSRNNSPEFTKIAALTFAANGIKTYLFRQLEPTPILSYTLRKLGCKGGVVVTASHNKKEYNGYKAYNEFGGQVTEEVFDIIRCIENIKDYGSIKTIDEKEALDKGLIEYLEDSFLDSYYDSVKELVIRKDLVREKGSELKVAYTPLHGAGGAHVQKVLSEIGFTNVSTVKEQEKPDGNFPTVGYPNPEDPKAFEYARKLAKEINADIIIGTDPDSDRLGMMARDNDGEYKVIYGNQIGILLMEYTLAGYKEKNMIPDNGYVIKSIVTSEAIDAIAKEYNAKLLSVLTGFKNIAEQMREFSDIRGCKYLFGFEESHGYLAGDFVRDKDGIIAALVACELALYYKEQGKTVLDALDEIYAKYGYFKEETVSVEIDGIEGIEKISNCMEKLRDFKIASICGKNRVAEYDFKEGIVYRGLKLAASNVLRFEFEDNYVFMVRPSGTEPKIKVYMFVKEGTREESDKAMVNFKEEVMQIINGFLA